MIKNIVTILGLVILVLGCTPATPTPEPSENALPTTQGFSGTQLAGTNTPLLEFNTADYEKAKAENKVILLLFVANWCGECRAEQPTTLAVFNELDEENVVGFKVNYKDSDTSDEEVELAKEFGITVQHTKVLIKNGQVVEKFTGEWESQDYLERLQSV